MDNLKTTADNTLGNTYSTQTLYLLHAYSKKWDKIVTLQPSESNEI